MARWLHRPRRRPRDPAAMMRSVAVRARPASRSATLPPSAPAAWQAAYWRCACSRRRRQNLLSPARVLWQCAEQGASYRERPGRQLAPAPWILFRVGLGPLTTIRTADYWNRLARSQLVPFQPVRTTHPGCLLQCSLVAVGVGSQLKEPERRPPGPQSGVGSSLQSRSPPPRAYREPSMGVRVGLASALGLTRLTANLI